MKVEDKTLIIPENDNFEIVDFDFDEYEKHDRKRWFYKLKCKYCGTVFTKRKENIVHKPDSIVCPTCYNNRHGVLDTLEYDMLIHYKLNARNRNRSWNLTDEQFKSLIHGNCYYCGCEPTSRYNKDYKRYIVINGIDRLDSTKGYVPNNVVSCCEQCNVMKMDYSLESFRNKIQLIYDHFIKSSTTIPEGSTSQANGDGNGDYLQNVDKDIV